MLQVVRKYTQGWVATIMGIIMSFAFVLWGVENYLSGHSKKQILAKVNGQEITGEQIASDVQRLVVHLREQVGSSFALPPDIQEQLKKQALNNVVMETVLVQAANKSGFMITPQETSAMIKQMPAFNENGIFSKSRFLKVIERMGYTQPQFINDVSNTLLLNQIASGIIGSGFVLPHELNQAVSLLEQKRDITYALLPSASFRQTVVITEDQIKAYYLQHKDHFKTPAKVQVDYILLSASSLKNTITVSNQEVKDYLSTSSGLEPHNSRDILLAKESIKQQKLEKAFLAASDKMTDLAYTHSNSLTAVANELGLPIHTTSYFSQAGGNDAFTKNDKLIAAAFNQDLIKGQINSNLIEIEPGVVAVLRVKNYQPQGVAPFKEVRDTIKHQLTEQQIVVLAKARGQQLMRDIKGVPDFMKILAREKLILVTKKNISRHEKGINPTILKSAFGISMQSTLPIIGTQLTNGDIVLILVENSRDFPIDNISPEQRQTMQKLYADTYGKIEYGLYMDHQLNHAKIKTYLQS